MGILGFNKTIISLSVGASSVTVMEAAQAGSAWELRRASSAAMQLSGPEGVRAALGRAFASAGIRKGKVSISFNDRISRALVMEFKELPEDRAEAGAIVAGRACKELYMRPEEMRLTYQAAPVEGGIKVFAAAVRKDAAEAYEAALHALGFNLRRITIHTLSLLALLYPRIADERGLAVVCRLDDAFTALFYRDGVWDFYRCKAVPPGGGAAELAATFAFYRGRNPGASMGRVYLFGGDPAFNEAVSAVAGAPVMPMAQEVFLRHSGQVQAGDISPMALLSALGAGVER
ncbi:MAG: hypothetical protein HY894_05810 [Deltaproteobacteria bacterium]|nr:hypothetical protein [Deltaproteobacteria bacterium]